MGNGDINEYEQIEWSDADRLGLTLRQLHRKLLREKTIGQLFKEVEASVQREAKDFYNNFYPLSVSL